MTMDAAWESFDKAVSFEEKSLQAAKDGKEGMAMRPQVQPEFFRGLRCALVMVIPFWMLVIAGTIWLLND